MKFVHVLTAYLLGDWLVSSSCVDTADAEEIFSIIEGSLLSNSVSGTGCKLLDADWVKGLNESHVDAGALGPQQRNFAEKKRCRAAHNTRIRINLKMVKYMHLFHLQDE